MYNKLRQLLEKRSNSSESSKQNTLWTQLEIQIGINQNNGPIYMNLTKNPSILLTGGFDVRNVFINNFIRKFELAYGEDTFEFQELSAYVSDTQAILDALQNIIHQCDERATTLYNNHVRSILEYNEKENVDNMKYIIIHINNYNEIYRRHKGREFEQFVEYVSKGGKRLGIYLIISTDFAEREFIPGVIKANVPTRITFKTKDEVGSMLVIDESGAEKLKPLQFIFKSYIEQDLVIGQIEHPLIPSEKRFL